MTTQHSGQNTSTESSRISLNINNKAQSKISPTLHSKHINKIILRQQHHKSAYYRPTHWWAAASFSPVLRRVVAVGMNECLCLSWLRGIWDVCLTVGVEAPNEEGGCSQTGWNLPSSSPDCSTEQTGFSAGRLWFCCLCAFLNVIFRQSFGRWRNC